MLNHFSIFGFSNRCPQLAEQVATSYEWKLLYRDNPLKTGVSLNDLNIIFVPHKHKSGSVGLIKKPFSLPKIQEI
jgi:hypothetical protein